MLLNRDEYKKKVLGCWMGKNIGGTLGAPFEWRRQINDVSFYTQDLGGEPLPNDDLDIQLMWLKALEEKGIEVDAHTLAEYWVLYLTPHWAEYGTAKINMRAGLAPPLSGSFNNIYKHSCGSFIRTEIWACIAPGLPQIAARYAYNDSILDHGDGEGTYAAVFVAALESAAFVISDYRTLLDIGLSHIPADCSVARAVRTAIECHDAGKTWLEARDEILNHHRGSSFGMNLWHTSKRDQEKGFHTGVAGYDVPSNIGILVLGLLYGEGDFEKTMTTTVNCGEDTDCTGATVGSIFGIINGINSIPERWIEPIGHGIKTLTLDLGDLWFLPETVDDLTDRTARIAEQVLLRNSGSGVCFTSEASDTADVTPERLRSPDGAANLERINPRYAFDFFTVEVDYGNSPLIRNGQEKQIRLIIHNECAVQANVSVHWYLPEGWSISPAADAWLMAFQQKHFWPEQFSDGATLSFTLTAAEKIEKTMNRAVVELTIQGRPTVMLVPITLLNGNIYPEKIETKGQTLE